MQTNTYNHLLIKRYEPFGYRWVSQQLPDYIHITITSEDDSKYLTVHSRIHKNKEVKMGPSYSTSFSDAEIIKDMSGKISYRFL